MTHTLPFILIVCVLALLQTTPIIASPTPPPPQQIMINGQMIDVTDPTQSLFQYVEAHDDNFQWSFNETYIPFFDDVANGVETFVMHYTSQKWLDETILVRPLWYHDLVLVKPKDTSLVHSNKALVYITGGHVGDAISMISRQKDYNRAAEWAKALKMMVAVIFKVPSTKIEYVNDEKHIKRVEDQFVAYSWAKFLENPSRPDFAGIFPQVKAAVSGLNVLELASAELHLKGLLPAPLKYFIVAGESKRGHTTLMTGTYEGKKPIETRRVLAIIPTVYDLFGIQKTVMNQIKSFNQWSYALYDYWSNNFTDHLLTREFDWFEMIADPLQPHFQEGLRNIPVMQVTAANDQFFMIDEDREYWDTLMYNGYNNYRRYVVNNADHSLSTNLPSYYAAVTQFVRAVVSNNTQHIDLTWEMNRQLGQLTIFSLQRPTKVTLYRSQTNPQQYTDKVRREFRQIFPIPEGTGKCVSPAYPIDSAYCFNPMIWTETNFNTYYNATLSRWVTSYSETGEINFDQWTAYYFGVQYGQDSSYSKQLYTTSVMVWPDEFPYEPCTPGDCHRTLG